MDDPPNRGTAQTGDNCLPEKVQTEIGNNSAAWAILSDELEDLFETLRHRLPDQLWLAFTRAHHR
jgi:hypothetical protein